MMPAADLMAFLRQLQEAKSFSLPNPDPTGPRWVVYRLVPDAAARDLLNKAGVSASPAEEHVYV